MPRKRYPVKRHSVAQPSDTSYRLIPLTQGQNAIVDASDYEWLNQWNWFAWWSPETESFYARRSLRVNGRLTMIHMARELLDCEIGEFPDHISHETLDNRRANIRKGTNSQNMCNRRQRPDNTSGYRGVTFYKDRKQWVSRISVNKRRIHLGYFLTPEDAAHSYDEAAKKYHGEFAVLNFH